MNFFDSLFSGVKWTTTSSVLVSALSIVKIAILTRLLEQADFGQFALVTSILSFINLFADFGLSVAILHKQNISRAAYSSLYWLGIGSGTLLYILFYFLSSHFASYFQEPILNALLPIAGLNIIIVAIGGVYRTIALKELQYRQLAIINILGNIAGFISAVFLAVAGWGVWALIYSTLLSSIISQILFLVLGWKNFRVQVYFSVKEVSPFWEIGKYSVGAEMINYFTREIDILLIGKLGNASILGAYSLAKQLVQKPGGLLNKVIADASLPILPKFQGRKEQLKNSFFKIIQTISTLNALIYILFFLFAGEILQVAYGSSYLYLKSVCRVFALFYFLRMVLRYNAHLIVATGLTSLSLLVNSITFPLTGMAVWIGFYWGIIGVAWAQLIIMVAFLFISWRLVIHRILNISLKAYLVHILPSWQLLQEVTFRILKKIKPDKHT